jgi:4-oxalocrotonate tautomerase
LLVGTGSGDDGRRGIRAEERWHVMPMIEVTAFEKRFEDEETARRVIAKLTDAFVDVFGEAVRDETWVVLHGVPSSRWGFGGKVRS